MTRHITHYVPLNSTPRSGAATYLLVFGGYKAWLKEKRILVAEVSQYTFSESWEDETAVALSPSCRRLPRQPVRDSSPFPLLSRGGRRQHINHALTMSKLRVRRLLRLTNPTQHKMAQRLHQPTNPNQHKMIPQIPHLSPNPKPKRTTTWRIGKAASLRSGASHPTLTACACPSRFPTTGAWDGCT